MTLEFDDDLDAVAKRHAEGYAFTFGAMGASHRNFYVEAFARQGFDEVREVHRLWLDGRRDEAQGLVPVEIGLKTNLLGTAATVKDRLRAPIESNLLAESEPERLSRCAGRCLATPDEPCTPALSPDISDPAPRFFVVPSRSGFRDSS